MAEDENKHLTPVWIVYVDGARLDTDHEGGLTKIHMDDRLNGTGTCTLTFDTSAVKLLDAGTLALESRVSVHLGYKDDCEEVFAGEITGFHERLLENGHEQVTVTCSNALHKLSHKIRNASYESRSTSDILKDIINEYSLSPDVDSFGPTRDYTCQMEKTDLEFLLGEAEKYGKTVYAYDDKVYVKDEVTVKSDDIICEWGKTLISFTGTEQLRNQISSCTFTGWDSLSCEAIAGTATLDDIPVKVGGSKNWTKNSNGGGGKWEHAEVSQDLFDNEDAKNRALGYITRRSLEYQTGEGVMEGNYRVHPGMRVNVKYVGKRFEGEYIADSVIHDVSVGGAFLTTVRLKRNMTE